MMQTVRQGEIVELEKQRRRAVVLSKEFFNRSGLCIVCPLVSTAAEDALHIPVKGNDISGVALCEQLKTLDLAKRHYRSLGEVPFTQIQELTDTVQGIFDYYPYG